MAVIAAFIKPIDIALLSTWNHGRTTPIMMLNPSPSLPSIAPNGTITLVAVIGEESLPRRPSPSNGLMPLKPGAPFGTIHSVLAPAAASGLLDHT